MFELVLADDSGNIGVPCYVLHVCCSRELLPPGLSGVSLNSRSHPVHTLVPPLPKGRLGPLSGYTLEIVEDC